MDTALLHNLSAVH